MSHTGRQRIYTTKRGWLKKYQRSAPAIVSISVGDVAYVYVKIVPEGTIERRYRHLVMKMLYLKGLKDETIAK